MRRHHILTSAAIALALVSSSSAKADVAGEARALIDAGDYEQAVALVNAELEARPKSNQVGTLNAIAGEALYLAGQKEEASKYLEKARAKGVADAYLFSGRIAMENYNFSTAAKMYDSYVSLKQKASKPVDEDAYKERKGAELASDMLERVENISIIDRIDVDHDNFFSHYKLSPESGYLIPGEAIRADYPRLEESVEINSPVFQNERGDFRLWAQSDTTSDGRLYIVESNRYIDGEWEEPTAADDVLSGGGDAAFPFMLADGATLYFASDGEGSIGGYDIFRSNRDSSTAQYKAPVNMGMPYNSPYNDYMLAIDESTGVGWWATDRNSLPAGEISIYIFIPNDLRRNHDAENPDIISLAKLNDISLTQSEDESSRIEELRSIINDMPSAGLPQETSHQFDFPVAAGRIYHDLSDFQSERASNLMTQWLNKSAKLTEMRQELSSLRSQYSLNRSDRTLESRILTLEKKCETETSALNRLRGEIIQAESKAISLRNNPR